MTVDGRWVTDSVVVPKGILGGGAVDGGVSYGLTSIALAKVNLEIINRIRSNPLTMYGIYLHDIAS